MKVKIINKSKFKLPIYETKGAAGFDIRSTIPYIVKAGTRDIIPTGLFVAVPQGCEIQIRPRSGNAINKGITVLNSPGTIDSDYRGEIKIILFNTSSSDFVINAGDKIAQGVLCPVLQAQWEEVEYLDETTRGAGGFGSTSKE